MREESELLVATHNEGKTRELVELLAGTPLKLRGLSELPWIEEAEETGATFAENAVLKARHYGSLSGLRTLADDSGLAVDALGGEPGIYSARYGGREISYAERMALLLEALDATGDRERRARFVCVIALADPRTGEVETFEGVCEGRIADAPRGTGGFGYDPLFVPEGFTQSFGELPSEIKQRLSHRARALSKARQFLLRGER
ncbi:MAG TPA: RdgB/HAM1 family non-canonical purine NTP pyrophosphatase [Pyrinomonadaceae bacterium]|nr:RdgB/HAM1 family non-canonical purine NTP pyrophosphatase [Pyrinomonadaceae bacterium]